MKYDITKKDISHSNFRKSHRKYPFSPLKSHKNHPFAPCFDTFHPPKPHIIASKFHHSNPIWNAFSIPKPTLAPVLSVAFFSILLFNFSFLPNPTIPISSPLLREMRGCQWHPSTAMRLAPGVRLLRVNSVSTPCQLSLRIC